MKLALPLLFAGVLSACSALSVGPDYSAPAAVSGNSASEPFDAANSDVFSDAALPAHWWQLYEDPELDTLVREALVHNTNLRMALANLERVEAAEEEAGGARKPVIGLNANPYYGHPSGLSVLQPGTVPPDKYRYSTGTTISYQLDVFGQLRRSVEAASASTEAARAALDLARVNVAGGTARAYAEVCSYGLRLDTARKSVSLQEEAVALTERLQQAGRVGTLDASRARSQLEQLRAALPGLEAQRTAALYRLATLTGRRPAEFPHALIDCDTPPHLTRLIPVGDGTALLRRRPDVRQAERELAAATARIGINMADRYPKITLGLSGSSAGTMVGFGHSDTLSWSLGPLISWTLPNTGVVDARIAQAQASTRMALAKFDGTVLTALRETETALGTYARELDRLAALRASRDEAARVAEQSRQLYVSGKVGFLDSLDADRALASADAALAASEASLADEQIQLFMALGGGWQEAPARTAASPRSTGAGQS